MSWSRRERQLRSQIHPQTPGPDVTESAGSQCLCLRSLKTQAFQTLRDRTGQRVACYTEACFPSNDTLSSRSWMSGPFRSTDNGELPLERRGKKLFWERVLWAVRITLGKESTETWPFQGNMAFGLNVWPALATQQKRTSSILLYKEKSLVWEGDLKSNIPFPSGVPFRCFLVVDVQSLRKDSWVGRQPWCPTSSTRSSQWGFL